MAPGDVKKAILRYKTTRVTQYKNTNLYLYGHCVKVTLTFLEHDVDLINEWPQIYLHTWFSGCTPKTACCHCFGRHSKGRVIKKFIP